MSHFQALPQVLEPCRTWTCQHKTGLHNFDPSTIIEPLMTLRKWSPGLSLHQEGLPFTQPLAELLSPVKKKFLDWPWHWMDFPDASSVADSLHLDLKAWQSLQATSSAFFSKPLLLHCSTVTKQALIPLRVNSHDICITSHLLHFFVYLFEMLLTWSEMASFIYSLYIMLRNLMCFGKL